jgi:hypothetical protein
MKPLTLCRDKAPAVEVAIATIVGLLFFVEVPGVAAAFLFVAGIARWSDYDPRRTKCSLRPSGSAITCDVKDSIPSAALYKNSG